MNKRIVVALGGNAILQPRQKETAEAQFGNVYNTCVQLADLVEKGYELAITHGNGPQVGNILVQNEEASKLTPPMPLDICGAQSQGLIGYMIQQSMKNLLPERNVGAVLTQVLVAADDPGFKNPSKPVGCFYTEGQARELHRAKGYDLVEDSGRGWRRVVPSPAPIAIIEGGLVRYLLERGVIVVAAGGGGIPVVRDRVGRLRGVEAVVDKDLAGQRLAVDIGAQTFLILTDVEGVAVNWGKSDRKYLRRLEVPVAQRLFAEGHFWPGSMGPKVEAAIRFVKEGGAKAVIAPLTKVAEALRGDAGTTIVN